MIGQCALRCLWPAPDLDHVHPIEPVSGCAGSQAAVPGRFTRFAACVPALGFAWTSTAQCRHPGRDVTAPLAINHQGQFPVVTISFNLAPGISLGEAVQVIDAAKQELGLPASMVSGFQGTAKAFQSSLANQPLLILAALVTVYIVLGVLYESYIHPATILSTLPSAGLGALLALMVCRIESKCHRAHRHHPADRHRGKERHHDRRLRARRRAPSWQGTARRHLPGVFAAVSSLPHHHHARLTGRCALSLWRGHRRQLRRPLGITMIGGPGSQPAADPLYDDR